MKRGRPKHADILTPREWEVLALLREGRTNEEISDRLGVSFYTAKFHVSEILSKLGVSTREDAVALLAARERRWLGLPPLPLLAALFHVKPARAMAFGLTIVVTGAALTLLGAWPGWFSKGAGQSAQETSQTFEALTDFVAGPVNQAPQNSVEQSDVDGLTLRIIEFFADETRTVVGYEIVGRDDEGPAAGPNAPPKLIDATGKTYRTIGAPATAGVTGRRATVLFQAIKPDAGSITLVFEGIRVGSFRHEGTWRAEHAWDGQRKSTNRQVAVSTLPQPFGIGTIQIDAVSHVLEGTMIHGHFEGYTPQNTRCPATTALMAGGPAVGWIGCRLGFGEGNRSFEITYPALTGEVQLEFRLTFLPNRPESPHDPPLSPEVLAHDGATATFSLTLPPRP
jgi:DNA-binding CsgD family transcriptional regulator